MNIQSILILALVVLLFGSIVYRMIRRKSITKCSCGCEGCACDCKLRDSVKQNKK